MGIVIVFVCLGAGLNLALWAVLWRKVDDLPAAFLALARRERAEGEARALTVLQEMAAARVGAITFSLRALEEQHDRAQPRRARRGGAARPRGRAARAEAAPVLGAASELVRELRRTLDELRRTLEGTRRASHHRAGRRRRGACGCASHPHARFGRAKDGRRGRSAGRGARDGPRRARLRRQPAHAGDAPAGGLRAVPHPARRGRRRRRSARWSPHGPRSDRRRDSTTPTAAKAAPGRRVTSPKGGPREEPGRQGRRPAVHRGVRRGRSDRRRVGRLPRPGEAPRRRPDDADRPSPTAAARRRRSAASSTSCSPAAPSPWRSSPTASASAGG